MKPIWDLGADSRSLYQRQTAEHLLRLINKNSFKVRLRDLSYTDLGLSSWNVPKGQKIWISRGMTNYIAIYGVGQLSTRPAVDEITFQYPRTSEDVGGVLRLVTMDQLYVLLPLLHSIEKHAETAHFRYGLSNLSMTGYLREPIFLTPATYLEVSLHFKAARVAHDEIVLLGYAYDAE